MRRRTRKDAREQTKPDTLPSAAFERAAQGGLRRYRAEREEPPGETVQSASIVRMHHDPHASRRSKWHGGLRTTAPADIFSIARLFIGCQGNMTRTTRLHVLFHNQAMWLILHDAISAASIPTACNVFFIDAQPDSLHTMRSGQRFDILERLAITVGMPSREGGVRGQADPVAAAISPVPMTADAHDREEIAAACVGIAIALAGAATPRLTGAGGRDKL